MKPAETENPGGIVNGDCPPDAARTRDSRRQVPGSVSYVPPVAGFLLASEVVKDILARADAEPPV